MGESTRILLASVESEPVDSAARVLSGRDDFRVVTAESAADSLETLESTPIDCVVSTAGPAGDALALLEAIRAEDDDLPVIFYPRTGSEEFASDAIAAGVTDYLPQTERSTQHSQLADRIANAVGAAADRRTDRRRRAEFRELLEAAPAPIAVVDRDGSIRFCNSSAAETLGEAESDAIVGESVFDRLDPAHRDAERARLERVFADREPTEPRSIRFADTAGGARYVRGTAVPVTFEDEPAAQLVFTDITDRIARERKLEALNNQLDTVVSNVPLVLFALDTTGTFTLSEGTVLDAIGLEPGEVVGESAFDTYSDHEEIVESIERALGGERVTTVSSFEDVIFETTYQPVFDDCGTVSGVIGVSYDVTQRNESERALRESKERLQLLFEKAPDSIIVHGHDGAITDVNEAAVEQLGYSREELLSMDVPEIEDGVTEAQVRSLWDQARPGSYIKVEGKHRRKDGTTFPVDVWVSLIEFNDTERFLAIARDITRRKARERELERQNRRLEEFTSIVSHDLRNPLNVATGHLELARTADDGAALETAERALERIETLITDLLTLARTGDPATDVEPVDLATLAERSWRTVDTKAAAIVVDTDRRLVADESRLRQLLENLCRNAVEHGGGDVTVTVGDLEGGGFYVEDDGRGIAGGNRDHVFESGYSTTREGTGIGLSIVKQIADVHGWDVSIATGDAGGARFEFSGVESPS